jgi:hypothetical protein
MDNVEAVRAYLRGQNLEQVGRADEAVALYEDVVATGFDSSGPYDRLIAIYADRTRHRDVIRIAELALRQVHTHSAKHAWYERMRADARRAAQRVPRTVSRRPR